MSVLVLVLVSSFSPVDVLKLGGILIAAAAFETTLRASARYRRTSAKIFCTVARYVSTFPRERDLGRGLDFL